MKKLISLLIVVSSVSVVVACSSTYEEETGYVQQEVKPSKGGSGGTSGGGGSGGTSGSGGSTAVCSTPYTLCYCPNGQGLNDSISQGGLQCGLSPATCASGGVLTWDNYSLRCSPSGGYGCVGTTCSGTDRVWCVPETDVPTYCQW